MKSRASFMGWKDQISKALVSLGVRHTYPAAKCVGDQLHLPSSGTIPLEGWDLLTHQALCPWAAYKAGSQALSVEFPAALEPPASATDLRSNTYGLIILKEFLKETYIHSLRE